eukprot:7466328-Alexandrium_andersonii.AAC.1
MSASLVGSEMCIRDRPPAPMRLRTAECGLQPAGPAGSRATELQSVDCSPVSYTHLTLPTICSV